MTESHLVSEILRRIGSRPDVRLWRQSVGQGWTGTVVAQHGGQVTLSNARPIHFGVAGQPDILGVVQGGRLIGIECKSLRGPLRTEQAAWRDAFEPRGVLWVLARSVEDVEAVLP